MLIQRGDNHEIRNTGAAAMETLNFYVPPQLAATHCLQAHHKHARLQHSQAFISNRDPAIAVFAANVVSGLLFELEDIACGPLRQSLATLLWRSD